MTPQDLQQLAQLAGIAPHWTDAFGEGRDVDADTLRTMLDALGLPTATRADSRNSAEALQHTSPLELPPLITAFESEAVALPNTGLREGTPYRLYLENGQCIDSRLVTTARGQTAMPAITQTGYHRFEAGKVSTRLAIAPRRCFEISDALRRHGDSSARSVWGLSAQLYSLRRAHDGGLADFTALERLSRAAAAEGAAALATSPVHAMFSADPQRFSPYGPSSRLFLNVLHIDPARVAGDSALRTALADVPDGAARWAALEAGDLVDWPAASVLRLEVLRKLFDGQESLGASHAEGDSSFQTFREQGGQILEDHACFEALDSWFRQTQPSLSGDWRRWPEVYRDPRSEAVTQFARAHPQEIRFHQFLQWQAAQGCAAAQATSRAAGMPIGLIADLAVGADPGGSQAWGLQSTMLPGLTVGAPPDLLSLQGQSWGLGAFSPRALVSQGFEPWLAMLRANMRYSGGIRIDHVLGLARLWLVPDGQPASRGAYLRYPFDDLLRLTALESWRHGAVVIGEDMGTVPEGFSARLGKAGVLGIRSLWFQREGVKFLAPSEWSSDALATTSTHDLATLAGWWSGRDIDWRERLDLFSPEAPAARQRHTRNADRRALWQALRGLDASLPENEPEKPPIADMLAFTAHTPSPLLMVPLEDLFGIVEQPNLPGTVDTHPNWRQRLPREAERMLADTDVQHRLRRIDQARAQSGSAASSEQADMQGSS